MAKEQWTKPNLTEDNQRSKRVLGKESLFTVLVSDEYPELIRIE
jgi:hypothetical protein